MSGVPYLRKYHGTVALTAIPSFGDATTSDSGMERRPAAMGMAISMTSTPRLYLLD